MTTIEFGFAVGAHMEKEANPLARLLPMARAALSQAGKKALPAAQSIGQAAQGAASNVAGRVAGAGKMLANAPEATGKFLTNTTRRAGNLIDPAGQAGSKITEFLGANNRSGNFANKVIGGGALALGGNAMLGGGGEGAATPEALNAAPAPQVPAASPPPAAQSQGGFGGLMQMWNNLPVEARYAIGAGVPLALAGGLMGMRGNTGTGLGLGALGLGAAGLGLAGSGVFGDGARRMVGQGANALYNMVGQGGGDLRGQLNTLKSLSPEFGTTMLMGRDPKLTSQQARGAYDFLTTNPAVDGLLPAVKAGALTAKKLANRRCWKGYEAVPGVKPYSRGSCRPVKAQKSTPSPKPEAAGEQD